MGTADAPTAARFEPGFTLTELVLVMVIAGVLAALALPRLSMLTFDLNGFRDSARAMIRHGHRTSIAQRRAVFVVVESGPAALSLCYDAGCAGRLKEPGAGGNYTFTAPSSVGISGPANFSFNALGRPLLAGSPAGADQTFTFTVSGGGSATVTIKPETGFVQ